MNYTPKQLQILRMIYEYQKSHGFSPTYAELAKELGVSTITVFEHLEALERKNAIRRRRHEARSVEIIEPNFLREQGNRRTLPLRGTLVDGKRIETASVLEEVPIGEAFDCTPSAFVLRAKGDALHDDHILDGDLLVLEGRENAADGELVVALLPDGQATFKRYFTEPGRVRLQPSNPALSPTYAEQVKVQGIFKGLVRRVQ